MQVVVISAMLGLIVTLLVLYELVLQVQVQIEGNIVLSLLPSFPLSALRWYYKRKSQKITNNCVKDEAMQQVYEEQQNTKMTGKSMVKRFYL